jgi:hypothetical protein
MFRPGVLQGFGAKMQKQYCWAALQKRLNGDNSKLVDVIKTEEIIFIASMFGAIQLACCPYHFVA